MQTTPNCHPTPILMVLASYRFNRYSLQRSFYTHNSQRPTIFRTEVFKWSTWCILACTKESTFVKRNSPSLPPRWFSTSGASEFIDTRYQNWLFSSFFAWPS